MSNYTINDPNVCNLLRILITIATSTSPLEQSFSKLSKICFKDRNNLLTKNFETLYHLAANNYPEIDYLKTTEILESHWLLGLFVCCLCFQLVLSEFMYVYYDFFSHIYKVLRFWLIVMVKQVGCALNIWNHNLKQNSVYFLAFSFRKI